VLAAEILGGCRVGIRIGDSGRRCPRPWRTGLVALILAIPVIPLIPIATATAATALATTGRLMRWLPASGDRKYGYERPGCRLMVVFTVVLTGGAELPRPATKSRLRSDQGTQACRGRFNRRTR